MWAFFKNKKTTEDESVDVWKNDFADCLAADYLPTYSVCQTSCNTNCRYVVRYSGMTLCSHREHKSFIPDGAEQFDPQRGQFRD